jgi:hypothetical protein
MQIVTSILVEKEVLEDLLNFKIRFVTDEINRILTRWNAPSIDDFLAGARDGTFKEAEGDAIDMTNLVDLREDLYRLRVTWGSA